MSTPIDTPTQPAPELEVAAVPSTSEGRPRSWASLALPGILIAGIIVFSLAKPGQFGTLDNARTILLTQSVLVMVALAELFVLITGDFDLSVGGNLAFGAILVAGLPANQHVPFWLGVFIAVLACALVGFINGVLVNVVRINAFISTLSTGLILGGIATWYTNGQVIYENIPDILPAIGKNRILGIPIPILLMVALVLAAWYVLEQTPYGRFLYALGGSRDAARLSRLNVRGLSISAFTISGLICGVAGVTEAAILGSGNPTVGPAFLLPAFAAVFLGATSVRMGTFNVFGTVLAVFAIAVGVAGLEIMGVPYFVEPVFNGVVLLIAVAATRRLRKDMA